MTATSTTSTTRGKLVVLEGIDGAGTTTQARRLVDALEERGHRAHLTREPSDGPIGRLLREILAGGHRPIGASGQIEPVEQTTLSLLFSADRADHLQREVEPALAAGVIVVSDRWYHSSLAYQGTGAERAWIRELNRRARRPDLTLFLEVDPRIAAARRAADNRSEEIFDRLAMQEQVAAGYRATNALLAADGERIDVLDGHAPLDEVSAEIIGRVLALLATA
jgi:dTMP kinase